MRVSEIYDSVAMDQLEGLDLYLGDLSEAELAELGFSLRKALTTVRKVLTAPLQPLRNTRVGKAVVRIHKDVVQHVRKVFTKKWFMKSAPFLAIAAQLLNFVIPGLGVLVGLAISASSTALAITEAKKAKRELSKAEGAANQEVAADQAAADVVANKALDEAYFKGTSFFVATYGMTQDKWMALPVEGKNKFLNIVIYDQHAAEMQKSGVTRDAFQAMGVGEQQESLSKMAQALPGSPGPLKVTPQDVVSVPVDSAGKAVGPVPSIAALTGGSWYQDPYILGGGAILALMSVAVLAKMRRSG